MIKVFNFDIDFAYSMGIPLESILGPNGVVYWQAEHDVTVTGIPPLLLSKSVGKPLVDWSITGNTVQNGTPTPEQPAGIKGVGDKIENIIPIADRPEHIRDEGITCSIINSELLAKGTTTKAFTLYLYRDTTKVGISFDYDVTISMPEKMTNIRCMYSVIDKTGKQAWRTVNGNPTISKGEKIVEIYVQQNSVGITLDCKWKVSLTPIYKIPVVSKGKNLFDKSKATIGKRLGPDGIVLVDVDYFYSDYIPINNTQTIVKNSPLQDAYHRYCLYDSDKNFKLALNDNIIRFESESVKGIKYIRFCGKITEIDNTQIELGTTATEYEPYKEPITTPLYLDSPLMTGERLTPQGRDTKWKELVLTGNETWAKDNSTPNSYGINNFRTDLADKPNTNFETSKSTHFTFNGNPFNITKIASFRVYVSANGVGSIYLRLLDSEFKTIDTVKVWLKSEYDAGRPVTVWYQLETPSTEPVSFPEIPILSGDAHIDTDTEVKPSAMSVTYKSK